MWLWLRGGLFASLLASAVNARIVPRAPTPVDPTISSLVASATSAASLKPYAKPAQKVEQVLAIGDSFSAGIGSNGAPDLQQGSGDCLRYNKAWPVQLTQNHGWTDFNQDLPTLTFGACSGATMNNQGGLNNKGLNQNQLQQGTPNPNLPYTPIGKPQIAVLTITGNDVGFTDAIVACVYRAYATSNDCQTTLNNIGTKIASIQFKQDLVTTMVNVISQGRIAGGANPAESFQVYIAGYVQFWNDGDTGCNDVTWSWWFWDRAYLTTDVRLKMNQLVDQLNSVISNVATELAASGVIYVDGFQGSYDTHRYCEPAPKSYLTSPIGAKTWFWHQDSDGYNSGTEGPTDGSATGAQNLTQMVLDELIPDKGTQATISQSNPPWNISPAFQNETTLINALVQADNDGAGALAASIYTKRSFHPKGTAYGPWSDSFLAAIKANRIAVNAAPPPPPPPPPAYATGTCCFHLDEWENCNPESDDLYANITLLDNNKNTIYQSPPQDLANGGLGDPINVGNGTTIQGPLPNTMAITGEHQNDYIQFTYGSLSWTSRTTSGPATCSNGGWNPRDGPACFVGFGIGYQPAENQMDCCFPC